MNQSINQGPPSHHLAHGATEIRQAQETSGLVIEMEAWSGNGQRVKQREKEGKEERKEGLEGRNLARKWLGWKEGNCISWNDWEKNGTGRR